MGIIKEGGEAAPRFFFFGWGEEWGDDQSGLEDLGSAAGDGTNGQGMVGLGKILLGHGRATVSSQEFTHLQSHQFREKTSNVNSKKRKSTGSQGQEEEEGGENRSPNSEAREMEPDAMDQGGCGTGYCIWTSVIAAVGIVEAKIPWWIIKVAEAAAGMACFEKLINNC
ncbi:hypothetical protein ACE6H2_007531 [Prunus campanulata]